jgi:L-amino acid N-acyltransferase YncA
MSQASIIDLQRKGCRTRYLEYFSSHGWAVVACATQIACGRGQWLDVVLLPASVRTAVQVHRLAMRQPD